MSPEDSNNENDDLKRTLDEADWELLKPHAARDGLIIVDRRIDLLTAGQEISSDNSDRVDAWIKQGLIRKPTAEELEAWNEQPKKKFMSLVVQPYVLAQELIFH